MLEYENSNSASDVSSKKTQSIVLFPKVAMFVAGGLEFSLKEEKRCDATPIQQVHSCWSLDHPELCTLCQAKWPLPLPFPCRH